MTARLKVPVPTLIKAVETAKKKAESQLARDERNWRRQYDRWAKAAVKAMDALRDDFAAAIEADDVWNGYNGRGSQSSLTIRVAAEWPGQAPALPSDFDVALGHLRATDATHILIDPDDRLDRFGRYLSGGLSA
jgi:hypothetical protein